MKWNRKNAKFFCVFFCSICRLGYFSVICFDGTMNFSNPEFLHKIVFVWHVFCKVFEEKRGFVFLEKVIIVRGFLPYFFTIFFSKKRGGKILPIFVNLGKLTVEILWWTGAGYSRSFFCEILGTVNVFVPITVFL